MVRFRFSCSMVFPILFLTFWRNRCMRRLPRGLERLSKNGDVSDKPSVEAIRKEYRKRSSTTLAYFDDQVTVTDSYDDWVLTDDWFRDYVTYCHNNDLKPKSKGEFLKEVEQDLTRCKENENQTSPKTSPLSAWRYIKFVPCVPRVPTSGSLFSRNEKNHQQQIFSISGEKAEKRGTSRTDGTANEKGVPTASGKPVLNVNHVHDGEQSGEATPFDKVRFCWNTCRNYHNEEEYGCSHPNPKSLNEKTVRPLKCPGFKPIGQEGST